MKLSKNKIIGTIIFILLIITIILIIVFNIKQDPTLQKIAEAKKEQKNIISYLNIPNTNINYYVVDRKEYEKEKEFNVLEDDYLFTYTDNKELLTKKSKKNNEIILGHNRKNLSKNPKILDPTDKMFGQLLSFYHLDFVKNNQFIYYTTDKTYKYKIFSVAIFEESFNKNEESFNDEYIKKIKDYSRFDFDVDVNENDKIISLSTCTRMFGNRSDIIFVVSAVMVDDKNNNLSNVKYNDDYIKVEENL